jgi:hypothetical protein
MIIKDYDSLKSAILQTEARSVLQLAENVTACHTYNRERKTEGIGIFKDGLMIVELFKNGDFEIIKE